MAARRRLMKELQDIRKIGPKYFRDVQVSFPLSKAATQSILDSARLVNTNFKIAGILAIDNLVIMIFRLI
jgi:hypothetical protein